MGVDVTGGGTDILRARPVGTGIAMDGRWSFSDVAPHFDEHVRQSVPGYESNHDLTCAISRFFCRSGGRCYDLGTSTGELLRRIAQANERLEDVEWIGIDSEPAMVDAAARNCRHLATARFEVTDLAGAQLRECDFVSCFLVLQFVPVEQRLGIVERIFSALRQGGGLVLYEKVRERDTRIESVVAALHYEFKRYHGISADEILNKAQSLALALEPLESVDNIGMLRAAGFRSVALVAKDLPFEGYLAIK